MSNWRQRDKKLDKRSKNKGFHKAFKQTQNTLDIHQRIKRQEIQAKRKEQDETLGNSDMEG